MSQNDSLQTDHVRTMAAMLFEFIETQINRADTKAGLILAADTLFATTVTVLSKGALVNLFDNAVPPLPRLTALLTILMFVALLISAVYALIVARPILRIPKRDRTWFFFGRVAEATAPDFIQAFSSQTPEEIQVRLLNEVYTISLIAQRKFSRVQRSFDFLIAALLLWAALQVLLAMAN